MSTNILASVDDCDNSFETPIAVDIRSTGGAAVLDVEHIEWLGRDVIRVDLPGLTLHVERHEARELASALQSLATFIEEESC